MSVALLFGIFFVAILAGTPLGVGIGLATVLVMEFVPGTPNSSLFIKNAIVGADNFPLVAVPMFILAGEIMLAGGLSKRIVATANSLVGRFRAGLAYVNVLASMFFAAISGSSPATVAAIGSNMIPEMEKRGYRRDFAAALTSASGMLGVMIPPSIPLIIYGVTANVSLGGLFLAGILPGILFGISYMIVARLIVNGNYDESRVSEDAIASMDAGDGKSGIWALIVPVIILGGIYGGIFTPTEAAGVAVIYALFVSVIIYKEIKLSELPEILIKSGMVSATVMIMVVMAFAFGRLLTIQQVPVHLAEFIMDISNNMFIIMLLINLLLLVVGMFMEPVAAIIILAPILLPVATSVGVDPMHFGIIMTCNLAIGFCTPPVGINLFVASTISGVKVEAIIRKVVPFLYAMMVSMLLVTYVPQLSTLLPSLAK
ncbi:TRAP transporter large permease [Rhodobacteraceae bacterium RKSG542]|uniref:TRAP transporter large permease n=1 Tax=Pseudovibrio flavus TaxID=2529854 RepID=UPI0012BBA658|nr:TRAP transporter large permease [Pseudovibrio flavus]MTI15976.1 TRAP transporter large permease [Pseudovibrio flavus]